MADTDSRDRLRPGECRCHRNLGRAVPDYGRAVGSNAEAAARAAHPRRQTELAEVRFVNQPVIVDVVIDIYF
jgi:hypothetical protein